VRGLILTALGSRGAVFIRTWISGFRGWVRRKVLILFEPLKLEAYCSQLRPISSEIIIALLIISAGGAL